MVTEPLLETRLALSCLEGFRTQSLPTKTSRLLPKKKEKKKKDLNQARKQKKGQEQSWSLCLQVNMDNLVASI